MSASLRTTPLGHKVPLELDLSGSASHPLERGLHDSPASIPRDAPRPDSRLGPSPVPVDFGFRQPSLHDSSDAGSFVDRGGGGAPPRAEEDEVGSARAGAVSTTQRIFSQLDTIKAIQARIAADHAALESISALPTLANAEGDPAHKAAEKDGGLGARSKEERERVGKAYENTADEFARREDGVQGLMAQLGELSAALKTLHSLPSPCLFPSAPTSPSSFASPAAPAAQSRTLPLATPPTKSDTDPVGAQDERERHAGLTRAPARARTGVAGEA
ncbi:hypothetical protein JCM10449v2_001396 [Rhodotorula kratochvilovae]